MHHSIVKNPQAEAQASTELAAAKERERALEAQLRELGIEPKVKTAVAPAAPTVIRHNMVPGVGNSSQNIGAMHHVITGPGMLANAGTPLAAPVAQFDAVTRVRDEVPGDFIIANQYGPEYVGVDGRMHSDVVGQVQIPKAQLGLRAGDEIVHVARVAVHAAPTQRAVEHRQMLIAQGKLKSPAQIAAAKNRQLPAIGEAIEREEVAIQPVTRSFAEVDAAEERFALIELGDDKR